MCDQFCREMFCHLFVLLDCTSEQYILNLTFYSIEADVVSFISFYSVTTAVLLVYALCVHVTRRIDMALNVIGFLLVL